MKKIFLVGATVVAFMCSCSTDSKVDGLVADIEAACEIQDNFERIEALGELKEKCRAIEDDLNSEQKSRIEKAAMKCL